MCDACSEDGKCTTCLLYNLMSENDLKDDGPDDDQKFGLGVSNFVAPLSDLINLSNESIPAMSTSDIKHSLDSGLTATPSERQFIPGTLEYKNLVEDDSAGVLETPVAIAVIVGSIALIAIGVLLLTQPVGWLAFTGAAIVGALATAFGGVGLTVCLGMEIFAKKGVAPSFPAGISLSPRV